MHTDTLIETHNLSRIYRLGDNIINALDDISISIKKGEFVSVMGPSGSGKSTFMNVVGCLDKPTAGAYYLEGVNVGRLTRDELSSIRNEKIGFVFQGFNLLSRTTAIENVELPLLYNSINARQRRDRAREALKIVGLDDRRDHHPNQLSVGQQQRVTIARAIVNDASILLADEPTGNLDTKTSAEIMKLFVELNTQSHITIILVTHESDIAAYGRRLVGFLDGKIISDEVVEKT
jgi:putative ABC transport system ATP-binding protein